MTALECDRCGKLYKPYEFTDLALSQNSFRFYKVTKEMIPDNYSHYLDLCPDCQKKLREWLENGKEKTDEAEQHH